MSTPRQPADVVVVRGNPTEEELAGLLVALMAASAAPAPAPAESVPASRPRWRHRTAHAGWASRAPLGWRALDHDPSRTVTDLTTVRTRRVAHEAPPVRLPAAA